MGNCIICPQTTDDISFRRTSENKPITSIFQINLSNASKTKQEVGKNTNIGLGHGAHTTNIGSVVMVLNTGPGAGGVNHNIGAGTGSLNSGEHAGAINAIAAENFEEGSSASGIKNKNIDRRDAGTQTTNLLGSSSVSECERVFDPTSAQDVSTPEDCPDTGSETTNSLGTSSVAEYDERVVDPTTPQGVLSTPDEYIYYWPEDGRPYVTSGKILSKQSNMGEARAVYKRRCQATQGENPYIWQCWAVLENKMGKIRRARELFDAATVADEKHIAAWLAWAALDLKQGDVKKARQLLAQGLKFCGGNEYIYQTLALLEAKANRYEQARYLFRQATKCNPKSCASWLAWAQLEVKHENNGAARPLFEKAVQASPKNRFAWHVWGVFEANMGNVNKGRKLLKIGHALNPRDPVLLQSLASLALLEYKHSTANLSRVLFRRASELDSKHQPVWIAWGWMEWKEGNISTARELYQKALSIDSSNESAARCLQAWGVLEERAGNLSAARRLFRSSLNVNSKSYVTWMTWASLEENQGNSVRAEEIRNLYFQQRTEVVDDPSWVMGFLDVIDPALDSIKRLLNLEQSPSKKIEESLKNMDDQSVSPSLGQNDGSNTEFGSGFDLDAFIKEKLSLDPSRLDILMETSASSPKRFKASKRMRRLEKRTAS